MIAHWTNGNSILTINQKYNIVSVTVHRFRSSGGMMDSMALYYPEGHQKHFLYAHPERPERLEELKKGLMEIGIWDDCPKVSPLELDRKLLESVHDQEYLKILERASRQAKMLDPDTFTTIESWQLALNAAGGGVQIADLVWERKAETGFALTRPPGHHATRNRGMGFCLINNISILIFKNRFPISS